MIWAVYLGLAALGAVVGGWRLLKPNRGRLSSLRFFLPRGFWSYALSTQQVGVVWFFIERIDYILVLNLGGLHTLGQYVAIATIAKTIPVINNFFLGALLPSLTSLIPSQNRTAASEVFSVHTRILLVVNAMTTCGLMLLATPLTAILGEKYSSLRFLLVLMVFLVGVASPGAVGATLLSSVGKQQRSVWVGLLQIGLFVLLFVNLWPRWGLLGAVLANGISMVISYVILLAVARRAAPVDPSVFKSYTIFAFVAVLAAVFSTVVKPATVGTGLAAWMVAIALFLTLARYRFTECMELLKWFVPDLPAARSKLVRPDAAFVSSSNMSSERNTYVASDVS